MSLREAAQQALEALEQIRTPLRINTALDAYDVSRAIAALRTALAEPEQEQKHIGPEWVPCVKLPVTVHVREQRPGEAHVSTREGITPIRPDDLIMRGVAGEEYPIGRELFNRTYRLGEHRTEPEQEPLPKMRLLPCCGYHDGRAVFWNRFNGVVQCHSCGQQYAPHPPQRKPLTDEEIQDIAKQYALGLTFPYDGPTTPELFARAIERAHGIGGEA